MTTDRLEEFLGNWGIGMFHVGRKIGADDDVLYLPFTVGDMVAHWNVSPKSIFYPKSTNAYYFRSSETFPHLSKYFCQGVDFRRIRHRAFCVERLLGEGKVVIVRPNNGIDALTAKDDHELVLAALEGSIVFLPTGPSQ